MTSSETAAETAPRRRRWPRRVLVGFLLLGMAVALAPFYLGRILHGRIVAALEEQLAAKARLESVSFSWPARLHLHGLELLDARDEPLAALDDLRASVALGALLTGKIRAEVELAYPELHLARAADGRWNWEHALEEAKARRVPSEPEASDGAPDPLPELAARVRIADGHVVIHGPLGETTLSELAFELDLASLDQPAPFRLGLSVRGPHGPAGGLTLAGSVTAAPAGRLEPAQLVGNAALALQSLDLAGFAPALALLAPFEGLAGVLDGRAELALGAGLALTGTTELTGTGLELRGPLAAAEPARIARIELTAEATQQGEGAGTQRLELRADSFLALTYTGSSRLPAVGAGELAGQLTLSGDLARLAELARGWVPLQPGVALAGRLTHTLELSAVLADRAPLSARVAARGGIEGLAARDADGRALDLAPLAGLGFELEGALDLARGTLSLSKLALRAGPVTCEGHLEAAGLARGAPPALALQSGRLRLQADLERLRGTLAQVLALEERSFGGTLALDATLTHPADALVLTAVVDGQALAFADTRLASLHGEIDGRRTDDGRLASSGSLRLGALTLSLPGHEPVGLPGAGLDFALEEEANGQGEHSLGFRTDDGAVRFSTQARSTRDPAHPEAELAVQGTFELEARVARLAELAAPFTPVQAGLAGELLLRGDVHATRLAGALAKAGGRLELSLTGLSARDAAGEALPLEALARTTGMLEGEFDAQAGRAELRSLALDAGGVKLRGSARARGLADAGIPELEEGRLELETDLARLGGELGRVLDLGGWTLSGSPLTAEVRLATQGHRLDASGRMAAARVGLARPAGAPLELAGLGLDFDLGYDAAPGSLHVRRAEFRSDTATLQLNGTLNQLSTPHEARGAMHLELAGRIERLLADLGLEAPDSGRSTSGGLAARFDLEGDRGAFRVNAKGTLTDLRLELAAAAEGQAPTVLAEPTLVLECVARVGLAALDVELEKLTLESGLARGGAQGKLENLRALGDASGTQAVRFVGLTGNLAYVPDRLGTWLAPLLPGKLSGAEEQRLTFVLDGSVHDFELASLLKGSQARVDLGLGRFERPEVQLDGAVVVETKDEKLLVRGDLGANGGTLQLDGTLDLAQGGVQGQTPPRSRLTVSAKGVRATAGLAPLLALVHPAFATAQHAQGSLEGLIGLDLDLTYDGPLTLAQLADGWETLPKEPIHGSGRLQLDGAKLSGSPVLALLTEFGVDASRALDLRPIEFAIQAGRVTYAKPWTWTLAGTETTFSGSIGLDQSLDLAWNVPITDTLVQRWKFLSALQGETLAVPLRGSATRPRLEVEGLLGELAAKAAKAELEGRLGLGKKSGSEDPDALLARADELWSQGQKSDAATLYLRLREDFKLSLTYALNKDRIKDRSKYKETPR